MEKLLQRPKYMGVTWSNHLIVVKIDPTHSLSRPRGEARELDPETSCLHLLQGCSTWPQTTSGRLA